jgi:hypothetical protein
LSTVTGRAVPDGDCASATELVAANNEAAQISVRKFLIAAFPVIVYWLPIYSTARQSSSQHRGARARPMG